MLLLLPEKLLLKFFVLIVSLDQSLKVFIDLLLI